MGELTPDELSDLHDLAAEAGCVDLLELEFLRRSIRQEKSESFINRV